MKYIIGRALNVFGSLCCFMAVVSLSGCSIISVGDRESRLSEWELHENQGFGMFRVGNVDGAISEWEQAVAIARGPGMGAGQLALSLQELAGALIARKAYDQGISLLTEATRIYEKLSAGSGESVQFRQIQAAEAFNSLAMVCAAQKRNDFAEDCFKKALSLSEMKTDGRNTKAVVVALQVLDGYAKLLNTLHRGKDAQQLLERTKLLEKQFAAAQLEQLQSATGALNSESLQKLLDASAEAYQKHNVVESRKIFEKAVKLAERSPNDPEVLSNLGDLGARAKLFGDLVRAEQFYRQLVELQEREQGLANPKLQSTLRDLADLSEKQGKLQQAVSLYEQIAATQWKDSSTSPTDLVASLCKIGDLSAAARDTRRAKEAYEQALTVLNKQSVKDPQAVPSLMLRQSKMYVCLGLKTEADEVRRKALSLAEKEFAQNDLRKLDLLEQLADDYSAEKNLARARDLVEKALQLRERKDGRDSEKAAVDLMRLTDITSSLPDYVQCERFAKRALSAFAANRVPDSDIRVQQVLVVLAQCYEATKQDSLAETTLKRLLAARISAFGADASESAEIAARLATFYIERKKYAQAEPLLKRAVDIRQAIFGDNDAVLLSNLSSLANVYSTQHDYAQAIMSYKKVLSMQEKRLQTKDQSHIETLSALARCYLGTGQVDSANAIFEQVIRAYSAPAGGDPDRMVSDLAKSIAALRAANQVDLANRLQQLSLRLSPNRNH